MSSVALVIVVLVAIFETWFFGVVSTLPRNISEALMIAVSLVWLLSPLLTLGLLAGSGSSSKWHGIITLAAALLCTAWLAVAAGRSGGGFGVFVVPAFQWLVVLAAIFAMSRVRARGEREART